MAYISSSQITVFPTTRRPDYRNNRLFSEANSVNLVNQLLDVHQFVISDSYNSSSSSPFEFNIQGYYFKIDTCAHLASIVFGLSSPNEVWATITLVTSGDYTELSGQDDGGEYQGVVFSNSSSSAANTYSLKILEKVDSNYVIPETSKAKFNFNRISGTITKVDGGTF